MPAPINSFKKALADGKTLFGCWMGLSDRYPAEVMGNAGFDWLVIDAEHSPNDLRTIRDQLMILDHSDSHPVVRVPIGETWIIKQVLDAGAQTILVPMVESADQARQLVRAVRYPPTGDRGVGYSLARASQFGTTENYGPTADAQICLLVQVENRKGLAALDEILEIEGIDGVFVGPADLAADLGHLEDMFHPDVQKTIMDTLAKISAAGKPAGILTTNETMINDSLKAGARFVAVALDIDMLLQTARKTAAKWKNNTV
ncbi:HpcH/HpaI aldolase/citrate lyase family protein [Roseobacter sp. YSTF-M11]|uniref:Hydroxypyruvate/pyruvate aldolase n=1 Tax=Roseobacter insulae TaxID=2859783 RepID=A0A9X1FSJ2_9RHOB|nr:HpcH/HpaI aldolase/citrate lyase family protein [Roseobacter insulae]MBW4706594.1 HpcH/HpaI aldolase/citrate lyase family protein [Roseobacter insulae]